MVSSHFKQGQNWSVSLDPGRFLALPQDQGGATGGETDADEAPASWKNHQLSWEITGNNHKSSNDHRS